MKSIVSTRYGRMSVIDADNVISHALALYGEWAMDELVLLGKVIAPGMCVLDVGAFIGTHTLAFSEFTGPTGKVYSFEPRKEIHDVLLENISLNNRQNITALNMGLAEKEQIIELQPLDINQGINFGGLTLDTSGSAISSNSYQVRVSTIDDLHVGKIDVIKLDVEGMERKVLDGAVKTILRDRPIIFCECNSLKSGNEVLGLCQGTQYDVFGFLAAAYNPNNFNAIKENLFGPAKELALLLIPREKSSEILQKIANVGLLPINDLEDLVLPLLYKPQYPHEVLAHTAPCSLLGLDFPSPALGLRDGQIADLNQVVVEREAQIVNLNQDVVERDRRISSLQRRESELKALSNQLRDENIAYRSSRSWRITQPLRDISRLRQRFARLLGLYQNYRQIYPGISGFRRLGNRCIDIVRNGGIEKLRSSVAMHERLRSTAPQRALSPVLMLNDIIDNTIELPRDVAVHAHIYYPDLAIEIRSYLANIPVKFHLYITTDTAEKAKLIESAFSNMENILVFETHITENRGRDIFPMLVVLGSKLAQHEIVLHIHTKRSPHNSWTLGGWRRYMMESLLGNSQRIKAIFHQFAQNEHLGILFPDPYYLVRPFVHAPSDANNHSIEKLLRWAGKKKTELNNIDKAFFPAGDMFWFRGKAIMPFVDMKLSADDFEPEEGQVDATLAHAIERMFPYFAGQMELVTKSFFSNSFLSRKCNAHEFSLFHRYVANGLIHNPILLFDHDFGGGTNTHTRELAKDAIAVSESILRIYHFEGIWFVQWIADGDGMLFYTHSMEELFNELTLAGGVAITINSLYGCPDIKEVISKILELTQGLKTPLDIKNHDFFALCPSPHLSDFSGKYCGVPQDYSVCGRCLKHNKSWYPSWYPKENQPVDIVSWRQPFVSLVEAATTVTFFDTAPIEIFRRAFHLEEGKVRVAPHKVDYFECDRKMDLSGPLHIGLLGTLTNIKGGKIVLALSDYIAAHRLPIPITVVGPSHMDIPPHINVHGPYEPIQLPTIVGSNGINVILVPSIVPETFSYTISEAMKMGLPIVAFDIGAQGNRVKLYELGKVVPLNSSPEVILAAIQSVLTAAQELKK